MFDKGRLIILPTSPSWGGLTAPFAVLDVACSSPQQCWGAPATSGGSGFGSGLRSGLGSTPPGSPSRRGQVRSQTPTQSSSGEARSGSPMARDPGSPVGPRRKGKGAKAAAAPAPLIDEGSGAGGLGSAAGPVLSKEQDRKAMLRDIARTRCGRCGVACACMHILLPSKVWMCGARVRDRERVGVSTVQARLHDAVSRTVKCHFSHFCDVGKIVSPEVTQIISQGLFLMLYVTGRLVMTCG